MTRLHGKIVLVVLIAPDIGRADDVQVREEAQPYPIWHVVGYKNSHRYTIHPKLYYYLGAPGTKPNVVLNEGDGIRTTWFYTP